MCLSSIKREREGGREGRETKDVAPKKKECIPSLIILFLEFKGSKGLYTSTLSANEYRLTFYEWCLSNAYNEIILQCRLLIITLECLILHLDCLFVFSVIKHN